MGGSNCGVCPVDQPQCKHGFRFTNIPAWLKDGQPHDIYVYGINLPGTGGAGSVLLNNVPKTLQCQPSPTHTPTPTTRPATHTPTPTFTPRVTPTPTATLFPRQPTPTPPRATPSVTPSFPSCTLTIDKEAFPTTARIDGQVGVTLKLEGNCPSEVGSAVDVALVIDRSASMCGGSKLDQAQAASDLFLQSMAFPPDQASVISFASTALLHTGLTGNRTTATNALYNIICGGFSSIDTGLQEAFEEMSGSRRVAGHTPAVILLTDGNPEDTYADDVRAAAQKLNDAGILLFTVGLGEDINANLLRQIASQPEFYYQSPSPDQLAQIYARLAGELRQVPAANLVLTDLIASNFDLVPDSFSGPTLPQVNGSTLRWSLPSLPAGSTELSFALKPKTCGAFPTNQSAAVSYDDNRGQRHTQTFPLPSVTITCDEQPPDAYVRDNEQDRGQVPSDKPWWVSPDIWVRHTNDGVIQHQNPQADQRNTIYVRIWNDGDQPLQDFDVQMYFANPSLGLSYPTDWNPLPDLGHVTSIAPHSFAIVAIPWDVPNISGHFCLFVRISSPEDPIWDDRTHWENNISQRNMHIIDYPQPQAGSCQFDENNLLTDRIAFDVVNTLATSSMVDLQIIMSNLGSNAEVRFEPAALNGRWTSLDGLISESDGRLLVTRFPATIYGVRLNPHELRTVYLEVKAPANSRFTVGLSEIVRGKIVGGNSYQRYLPPCPLSLPLIIRTHHVCLPDQYTAPDVMLVIDRSGSMNVNGKLDAAKDAVHTFLEQMDFTQEQAGLVSFATTATLDQPLTTNRSALEAALNRLTVADHTAIGEGIAIAHVELNSARHLPGNVPALILLSDGQNTRGRDPVAAAAAVKEEGIRLITIGLGEGADANLLRQIASEPADYYFAPNPDDLIDIYGTIAGELRCIP